MKAIWNELVLAESADTVVVEGNHYFARDSINAQYFAASATRTQCAWKGTAHYYSIVTPSGALEDAAWYYPEPLAAAASIKDRIAFWRGVKVVA